MSEELTLEEKWEQAGLSNGFIFYLIMRNHPEECKQLLEILLEMEIDRIQMNTEDSVNVDPFAKGIRMDVYAKNSTQAFDIELQAIDTKELPLRARYYQGIMDVDNLSTGEIYSSMKETYIIFICLEDIFRKGLPLYTFENICVQENSIKLNDNSYKYFFAACNCDKLLNERQRSFFNLLLNNKCDDDFTEHLSNLISSAKHNVQWRMKYMEFEREKAYARLAGHEVGLAEGRAEGRKEGLAEGLIEGRKEGLAEGRKEGLAEGHKEGLVEGRKKGLAEGLAEGRNEKALEDAIIAVQKLNASPKTVAELFNINIDELLKALAN